MNILIDPVQIGHITIGDGHPPFIIAEMSGNHNQSLQRALDLVDAAASTGAHALKLQTYTADTITVQNSYVIDDADSGWNKKELYELYKLAYTPWEWHKTIFERARSHGMIAFSSPFDTTAVDFLEELEVPAYKIASFENTDWILLRKVALTGKPIIISTGVSNISDLDESIRRLREYGAKQIIMLKCTSTYPASPVNSNIATIPHMRELFRCHTGLSDHTMGVGVAVASVALGAKVIEKHFTLRRADGGVDSAFSLEPEEMKSLVVECERAFQGVGAIQYGVQESEKKSAMFKRSLYVVQDIVKGEKITGENVQSKRPGLGIHTKHFEEVVGRLASKDIRKGTPFSWDLIN